MRNSKIIGTGIYLPEKVVSNIALYPIIENFDSTYERVKMAARRPEAVGLSDAQIFDLWVKRVTGISERRHYDNDFRDIGSSEGMGLEAAKRALDAAKIKPVDLDYIIMATFTPGRLIPNPACTIAGKLGANCGAITINTACSGFLDGLIDAECRIRSGRYDTVLVVASETLSKKIDYRNPKTAILFGDGAGAAVLEAGNNGEGILGVFSNTIYSENHIVLRDPGLITMDGGELILRRAVDAMKDAGNHVLAEAGLKTEEVKYFIPHQANSRITESLARAMNLPDGKIVDTIERVGNTSGASIAIALDKLFRGEIEGMGMNAGDLILLTSVGGGYTSAGLVFRN